MKSRAITETELQQCEVGKDKTPIFQEGDLKEKK